MTEHMSAAERLRAAIEAAPEGLRVAPEHPDDLVIWDSNDDAVIVDYNVPAQAAMPLIGLLLAAAPHLADLLDGLAMTGDKAKAESAYAALRDAITEHAQAGERGKPMTDRDLTSIVEQVTQRVWDDRAMSPAWEQLPAVQRLAAREAVLPFVTATLAVIDGSQP